MRASVKLFVVTVSIFAFLMVAAGNSYCQVLTYRMGIDTIKTLFDSVQVSSVGIKKVLQIPNAKIANFIGTYECDLDQDNELVVYKWFSNNGSQVTSEKSALLDTVNNTLGDPASIEINNFTNTSNVSWNLIPKIPAIYWLKIRRGSITLTLNYYPKLRGMP